MATFDEFPTVENSAWGDKNIINRLINVLRGAMRGKVNNVGTVTLTAGAASTVVTVTKESIGPYTNFIFVPKTVTAATEFGAGSLYVSSITIGALSSTFTITHANTASVDKTFNYIMIG